jgi:geranyl-CoA carboxylase alpha subunit
MGPKPEAMLALGNKSRAKELAHRIGVPCLAGYQGDRQDDQTLAREADRIGYPLLIKAAAGGGGRGMRRVDRAEDLSAALESARTESKNAFGSDQLLLEQLAERARHVEIQVLADEHGRCVTLGERDCSVQRRHQKVIEESPCPVLSAEKRMEMSAAARTLAVAAGYTNAGTVEFLLDQHGQFFFLEMNTRLQVEHPVTEQVTKFDLVELQIRIARGESISDIPLDVPLQGHSIEARLYAEDPSQGFMPQTGKIERWVVSSLPSLRVDHGVAEVSLPFTIRWLPN